LTTKKQFHPLNKKLTAQLSRAIRSTGTIPQGESPEQGVVELNGSFRNQSVFRSLFHPSLIFF
jgi:hypothetical protein